MPPPRQPTTRRMTRNPCRSAVAQGKLRKSNKQVPQLATLLEQSARRGSIRWPNALLGQIANFTIRIILIDRFLGEHHLLLVFFRFDFAYHVLVHALRTWRLLRATSRSNDSKRADVRPALIVVANEQSKHTQLTALSLQTRFLQLWQLPWRNCLGV